MDGPVLWFPFPLLASGDPQNKKALAIPCVGPALEQEACRVGLLRLLQNLNDDATMPSSPYKLWTLRPRGRIEPLHVHMSLDLKSSPDPSRNHGGPTGAHKSGYQHATFTGGSSARARPRMPPLGRRARKLWGPALEQEAPAGMPPKKHSLGRRARKLWGPALEQEAPAGMPPKKHSLGRCARKLWGPALEQEALAGMPPKKLSRTLR